MFGMGDYEFLGYLVQISGNQLLILVPDDIPDVENTQEDDAGGISWRICLESRLKTNVN